MLINIINLLNMRYLKSILIKIIIKIICKVDVTKKSDYCFRNKARGN